MKPCSGNRKHIALLAANALDAPAADKLREHITTCAGCQDYFREISGVASRLAGAHEVSEIEVSERFHQRLAGRIRRTDKEPLTKTMAARLGRLKWRILIPVAGISLLVGTAIVLFHNPNGINRPQTTIKPGIAAGAAAEDISPTFANYQNAANRSFEELDSLLTRQAREGPPPVRIDRASGIALAQEPL